MRIPRKQLKSSVKYDANMDKNCIALCDALNALPSIHTVESCEGHGKEPFRIWFKCDDKSLQGLFFLTRCFDRRYSKYGHEWSISLEVGDTVRDGILPTMFVIQSTAVGEEAYKQAADFVDNLNDHLNHENFMKGFNLDVSKFQYTIFADTKIKKIKSE